MTANKFSCLESNADVLSVIYDPTGNAVTHGDIVEMLNDYERMKADERRLPSKRAILHARDAWRTAAERLLAAMGSGGSRGRPMDLVPNREWDWCTKSFEVARAADLAAQSAR